MVPKQQGSWRLFLNTAAGFDFEGGHFEDHGLDASGNIIDVPLHRHTVTLDFARVELEAQYTFRDAWDVWFRLPYEVKDQTASITNIDPVTPTEQAAIERNANAHHRTETYDGFSDAKLLVSHWRSDVVRGRGALELALGTTLPIGRTEADPFKAGDAGEQHLHIQFGSGTFDPIAELHYALPFQRAFVARLFTSGRFPLYENDKTYRAPLDVTTAVSLSRSDVLPRTSLRLMYAFLYQGFGHWDGERDPNSGVRAHGLSAGLSLQLPWNMTAAFDFRQPLSQETLSGTADAFELGPTLTVTLVKLGRFGAPKHDHDEEEHHHHDAHEHEGGHTD